jgi:hypothetical protein
MRHFGVGQAEIRSLKGDHSDLVRNEIHFRRMKTGKLFDVSIFPHAKPFIEALRHRGGIVASKPVVEWRNPRKSLESACKNLGLPIHIPRALRRTFLIHCLERHGRTPAH